MVTRVRIEAEGSSTEEVSRLLEAAHEHFVQDASPATLNHLFGNADEDGSHPGLAQAQSGEFVIERFARQQGRGIEDPSDGQIVFRGRMTTHFARPADVRPLTDRGSTSPTT